MKNREDEVRLLNTLRFLKEAGAEKNVMALVLQGFIQETGILSDETGEEVKRILGDVDV